MTSDDVLLADTDTIDDIDRAIRYCRDTEGLVPAIRDVFIDALLDKRKRLTG